MTLSNSEIAAVTELNAFFASAKKTDRVWVDKRDFYSLSYRYEGKITVDDGNGALCSEAGSITFIPKGISYKTEILEDMRMVVIHFKLDKDVNYRNAAVITPADPGFRLLFERIVHDFHTDKAVDFRCMSAFYELLARLEELPIEDGCKRIPEKIRQVRKFVEQHYADPTLSISFLAERFGISTAYLRREFLRAYQMTPIAFLQSVRVGNAQNMLASKYLSVGEIAEQCGFSSASYFIQVFRKSVGESPDKYRKGMI